VILSFFASVNVHKDKTKAAQAKTAMTIIDELNEVSRILSVSLGQLSKAVMQLFHPEGSERRLLAK